MKLGSSRGTLNGPDWTDVAGAITATEDFHQVGIDLVIRLSRPGHKGLFEARMTATRWTPGCGVPKPSVSRSVQLTGGDPLTVAATIFRLVYDVDKDCGAMWAMNELF